MPSFSVCLPQDALVCMSGNCCVSGSSAVWSLDGSQRKTKEKLWKKNGVEEELDIAFLALRMDRFSLSPSPKAGRRSCSPRWRLGAWTLSAGYSRTTRPVTQLHSVVSQHCMSKPLGDTGCHAVRVRFFKCRWLSCLFYPFFSKVIFIQWSRLFTELTCLVKIQLTTEKLL